MPDLLASLLPHDLGHLRILAEFWGLTLNAHERDSAARELSDSLLDPQLARETMDILPAEGRTALDILLAAGGRLPWAEFARQFGEIRQIGAGKRDRDRPHRNPVSAAEILFYRGFLAKAFFDSGKGAQEFAYIPDDLLEIIRKERTEIQEDPLGRPATPVEKAYEIPASDRILDDATTLLAALRMGEAGYQPTPQLSALLQTAKLLRKNIPQAEVVKTFLEAPRTQALSLLIKAWKTSTTFNELRLLPSIICEGEWKNSQLETRQTLLNLIQAIPINQWWSLPAFLRDLKLKHPDFQRPAGDYDSWFIKRAADGQYLRGFAYWDAVDGALVRFFIQILHWLGLADLAAPEEGMDCTAFRITFNVKRSTLNEKGKIIISSNGKIFAPRLAPRAIRYQISRFCEWDEEKPEGYPYYVTAQSLKHATQQGLKAEQLLSLLVKHTNGSVSPALVKALKRWESHGTEARAENMSILRVSRPEVLEELRASKAGRFLGEPLGPTAVIIKGETIPRIAAALAELGLLLDVIEPPGL
jgi:Helicase conserved C-terminal domain